MKYARESLMDDGVLEEVQVVVIDHLTEVGPHNFELSVDWAKYVGLDNAGILRLFTARDNGKLVGYASYVVDTHLHFSTTLFAIQDSIFLYPDHRGNGKGTSFGEFCQEQLADCDVMTQTMTPLFDFSDQLKKNGYSLLEHVYIKNMRKT